MLFFSYHCYYYGMTEQIQALNYRPDDDFSGQKM